MNQYYTEKQQTQYVDDTMRKARVQARKAQQTGGVIPSVKGIRESVSQPTVSAAPSTPSVQTTPSVPTVRPPSVTSPALTTPNAAADVPLSTPKPTVSKTYTANVQRANSDILNANKQKATADVWGTDPAPAASPLQTAAPAKAAAVKIKQTDYTKPDAGGILKPQAPVKDVPVSTVPVSNRTALFGAKDTPDLTLTAKKLEQMGDLYREFSPQQRALLDDYYKDDPASLNVIRGRTTGNDWLLAQSRAAQSQSYLSRQNIAATEDTVYQKGLHKYSVDENGQLVQNRYIRLDYTTISPTVKSARVYDRYQDEHGNWIIQHVPEQYSSRQADLRVNATTGQLLPDWEKVSDEIVFFVAAGNTLKNFPKRNAEQPERVPSLPNRAFIVFAPVALPPTSAGGNGYATQSHRLDLSYDMQREIYKLCKLSGVDYFLTLAIIAHESNCNPTVSNRLMPSVRGLMQVNSDYLESYVPSEDGKGKENIPDYYAAHTVIRDLVDYADSKGANMLNAYDPLANVAYGIGAFYEHYRATGDIELAMYKYAGGINNESARARAKEILYYRDLLAQAAGFDTWYMEEKGFYHKDGTHYS